MTKDVGILLLGLLVAAMPYLGFPIDIERIIFTASGLLIALLAFLIRGDFSFFEMGRSTDTFTENGHNREVSEEVEVGMDSIVERGEMDSYEEEQEEAEDVK